jgi:tartrate dehydrogenase/decarboxylase/D-malate dehydrogenase
VGSGKKYRIAVIPGDGIGREVVPEGIRVLEAAAKRFGFQLEWQHFDWSCETYRRTGCMMPKDGLDQLRPFDAIFLGIRTCRTTFRCGDC